VLRLLRTAMPDPGRLHCPCWSKYARTGIAAIGCLCSPGTDLRRGDGFSAADKMITKGGEITTPQLSPTHNFRGPDTPQRGWFFAGSDVEHDGGFLADRVRPHDVVDLLTGSGSLESLNPSAGCGLRAKSLKIRPMVDFEARSARPSSPATSGSCSSASAPVSRTPHPGPGQR
jgi:hypothetical protein